jgi:hypothetical protein
MVHFCMHVSQVSAAPIVIWHCVSHWRFELRINCFEMTVWELGYETEMCSGTMDHSVSVAALRTKQVIRRSLSRLFKEKTSSNRAIQSISTTTFPAHCSTTSNGQIILWIISCLPGNYSIKLQ